MLLDSQQWLAEAEGLSKKPPYSEQERRLPMRGKHRRKKERKSERKSRR